MNCWSINLQVLVRTAKWTMHLLLLAQWVVMGSEREAIKIGAGQEIHVGPFAYPMILQWP
jgi:hypothetical protein